MSTTPRTQDYGEHMAIARLHDGPLDGQILPLEDIEQDRLIAPYGATQVVYRRGTAAAANTGASDGPTEVGFWFVESSDDITPSDD
ncbi:hypothetical protein GCM10027421_31250 [Microbacterium shaanxiense]